jgi:hypothetical protein
VLGGQPQDVVSHLWDKVHSYYFNCKFLFFLKK